MSFAPRTPAIARAFVSAALLFAVCLSTALADEPKSYPAIGSIERLDPRLDALIEPGTPLEKLAEGFNWSEGPVWDPKSGELYFSDVPENVVFAWNEKQGVREYLKPSGYTGDTPRGGEPGSNGLLLEPGSGLLVLCQHGDRRVARMPKLGVFETIADRYEGKRFNSPNDAAYKSNGDLYFTDPPYGLLKLNDDPAKEIPFNGVYRVDRQGKVTLLTKEMTFPNGIAFSHDEKHLYVAQSDPKAALWKKFPVNEDGTLGKGELFFDATDRVGKFKGLPDGMKVDVAGNVYATGPSGVLIFAPDGAHLGTILTGEATGNCCFGNDGSTLYIMADMYLCRIKTKTKGCGFAAVDAPPDNQLTAQEQAEGWQLLFNGRDTTGWKCNNDKPIATPVEDGSLLPHRSGGYLIVYEKPFGDFILKCDVKMEGEQCNSGIFFRVGNLKNPIYSGFEVQVFNSNGTGMHDFGAIYDLVAPSKNNLKGPGEWNHVELTCKGPLITVAVNGEEVASMNCDDWPERGLRPDGSKHKFGVAIKDLPRNGYLGFQDHGNKCWYKNVKLLELKD